MNDVIRVYDARDADCAGAGLGVISPTECEATEAAGGDYVLTAAIPIADGTGWELALLPRTPQGVRAELTLPLPTRPFPIETTVEFRSQPSHPDEHSTTALQHQLRRELYLLTRRHSGN